MEQLQALRGMPDLLPHHTALWHVVEATARRHFQQARLGEIRTPLLELTQLFARGIGEATDVVGKEMYSFADRSGRPCTLRPEGTASVVRAAIQHGLLQQGPQRLWYMGPMFRYERPQAGRQRQFHQIGVELLGFPGARSDAEVIAIAWHLLQSLGVSGLELEINTLGTVDDRRRYRAQLTAWLEARASRLDADSQHRLSRNPLRILDSKNRDTQALLAEAPQLADHLGPESRERFAEVCRLLAALDIPFKQQARLVRGLDYYGHTAFEITTNQLGAQATVCGGGRYDGLVSLLGGPDTPGIGWAIGMERLVLLMGQQHAAAADADPQVIVVNRGPSAEARALVVAHRLRRCGWRVDLDHSGSGFGKQFKRADRLGAALAVVIGEEEARQGAVKLKPMGRARGPARQVSEGRSSRDDEQERLVPEAQLPEAVRACLAQSESAQAEPTPV